MSIAAARQDVPALVAALHAVLTLHPCPHQRRRGGRMNPLPYAPDHHDPEVVARRAEQRALVSQIDRRPRYTEPPTTKDQP